MVIKANPKPIQRLKDKGFDVYKADIVSSKNGEITFNPRFIFDILPS